MSARRSRRRWDGRQAALGLAALALVLVGLTWRTGGHQSAPGDAPEAAAPGVNRAEARVREARGGEPGVELRAAAPRARAAQSGGSPPPPTRVAAAPAGTPAAGRVRLLLVDSLGRTLSHNPDRLVLLPGRIELEEITAALGERSGNLFERLRHLPGYRRVTGSARLTAVPGARWAIAEVKDGAACEPYRIPGGFAGDVRLTLRAAGEVLLTFRTARGAPLPLFFIRAYAQTADGAQRVAIGSGNVDATARHLLRLTPQRLERLEAAGTLAIELETDQGTIPCRTVLASEALAAGSVEFELPELCELEFEFVNADGSPWIEAHRSYRLTRSPGGGAASPGKLRKHREPGVTFRGIELTGEVALEVAWVPGDWNEVGRFALDGLDPDDPASLRRVVRFDDRMLVLEGRVTSEGESVDLGTPYALTCDGLRHHLRSVSPRRKLKHGGRLEEQFAMLEPVRGTYEFVLQTAPGNRGTRRLAVAVDVPAGGGRVDLGVLQLPGADDPRPEGGIEVRVDVPPEQSPKLRVELSEPGLGGAVRGAWRPFGAGARVAGREPVVRVPRPAPGQLLRLEVQVAGGQQVSLPQLLEPDATTLRVSLVSPSELAGRVAEPAGVVLVARPAGFSQAHWSHRIGLRPSDGAFLRSLPAGRWSLGLLDETTGALRAEYRNLDLPPGGRCADARLKALGR